MPGTAKITDRYERIRSRLRALFMEVLKPETFQLFQRICHAAGASEARGGWGEAPASRLPCVFLTFKLKIKFKIQFYLTSVFSSVLKERTTYLEKKRRRKLDLSLCFICTCRRYFSLFVFFLQNNIT